MSRDKFIWRTAKAVLDEFLGAVRNEFGDLGFRFTRADEVSQGVLTVYGGEFAFRVSYTGEVTVGAASVVVYAEKQLRIDRFHSLLRRECA